MPKSHLRSFDLLVWNFRMKLRWTTRYRISRFTRKLKLDRIAGKHISVVCWPTHRWFECARKRAIFKRTHVVGSHNLIDEMNGERRRKTLEPTDGVNAAAMAFSSIRLGTFVFIYIKVCTVCNRKIGSTIQWHFPSIIRGDLFPHFIHSSIRSKSKSYRTTTATWRHLTGLWISITTMHASVTLS